MTTPPKYCKIDPRMLRVGVQLRSAIYDNRNVLLLAAGKIITPRFRQNLLNRSLEYVSVAENEMARLVAGTPQGVARETLADRRTGMQDYRSPFSDSLDSVLNSVSHTGLPVQGEPFAKQIVAKGNTGYDAKQLEAAVEQRERSVQVVMDTIKNLMTRQSLDVGSLQTIADEAMNQMTGDSDLFTALGINPFSGDYPARHSVQVTMLSLAIGTHLQLDSTTLRELAVGCLIHDAAMLKLKQPYHELPIILDPIEFLEVTKHPVMVFDVMKNKELVPQRSAFVAYQMHERCDGSGYPRGRDGTQIHFLSKVAAVADTFVGLVSPRPYRPAMLPYAAIERLIRQSAEGIFDGQAVRALLQTVSLFPLGSFVRLSDGRVAKVLRTNGAKYDKPKVEAWFPEGDGTLETVDLMAEAELRIVAVCEPQAPPVPKPAAGAAQSEQAALDNWE